MSIISVEFWEFDYAKLRKRLSSNITFMKLIERVSVVFYFREATKQHSEEAARSTKVTGPKFDINDASSGLQEALEITLTVRPHAVLGSYWFASYSLNREYRVNNGRAV